MLISSLAEVKRRGGDVRTLGLYGQELIHITAAIARMNLVLHGVEDFEIVAGNTLSNPGFIERDRLRTFDVVLANPPYSIKKWNREAWQNDPWGRNFLGTPPQGRADYAFFQHILKSLDPKTGRCAILFPHGVLFRNEESEMRRKLVELDLLECVLGLGPNLFYNSPMEACVVVCRTRKPAERQRRILFIDAVHEVARERAQSFLKPEHQQRILAAYRAFADEPGFAKVATIEEVLAKDANLSIPRYVRPVGAETRRQRRRRSEEGVGRVRRQRPRVLAADGRARRDARQRRERGGRRCLRRLPGTGGRTSRSATSCDESTNGRAIRNRTALSDYVGLEHIDPDDLTIRRWGTSRRISRRRSQTRFAPVTSCSGSAERISARWQSLDFDGDLLRRHLRSRAKDRRSAAGAASVHLPDGCDSSTTRSGHLGGLFVAYERTGKTLPK